MLRKAKHVTFHQQSNFIPVVGDIGKHLPSQHKTLKGLTMHVSEVGVHVKFTHEGLPKEFLFPQAAIQFAELDPEGPDEKEPSLAEIRSRAKLAS